MQNGDIYLSNPEQSKLTWPVHSKNVIRMPDRTLPTQFVRSTLTQTATYDKVQYGPTLLVNIQGDVIWDLTILFPSSSPLTSTTRHDFRYTNGKSVHTLLSRLWSVPWRRTHRDDWDRSVCHNENRSDRLKIRTRLPIRIRRRSSDRPSRSKRRTSSSKQSLTVPYEWDQPQLSLHEDLHIADLAFVLVTTVKTEKRMWTSQFLDRNGLKAAKLTFLDTVSFSWHVPSENTLIKRYHQTQLTSYIIK